MPVWVEPTPPNQQPRPMRAAAAPNPAGAALRVIAAPLIGCFLMIGVFFLFGVAAAFGFRLISVGIDVVIALAILGALAPRLRKRVALARFRRQRDAAYLAHQAELAAWQERVARHNEAERRRRAAALRWYPVTPWSAPERIDVFGGTPDGWASLLATLGCSLLHGQASIVVLDFTEQRVGDGLAEFAARHGYPVRQATLPDEWSTWRPLAGLSVNEAAELLADVVHGMRASTGTAGSVDGRALDAELCAAVLAGLDRPWTFRRITAGIRVLRRLHDHHGTGVLTTAEVGQLTSAIDTVGHTDRVAQELQFLGSVLDLLAAEEPDLPGPDEDDRHELLAGSGLAILRTTGTHRRGKDVLDRVVLHRVIRGLHDHTRLADRQILVVAGADQLGREGLEELTRQAERTGVRLVLMLERLRSDVQDLLGGRYSATVLMRLGNAREATAAAEIIGRDHTFVLSQLTRQVGATFTEGTASTHGMSDGVSDSRSASVSDGRIGRYSVPFAAVTNSMSVTRARTETWQDTVNRSLAESVTTGQTVSRVYEFTVEPTTVQSLPATAFVLVEAGPTGRRVVLGDCNPGVALLDWVASDPRLP